MSPPAAGSTSIVLPFRPKYRMALRRVIIICIARTHTHTNSRVDELCGLAALAYEVQCFCDAYQIIMKCIEQNATPPQRPFTSSEQSHLPKLLQQSCHQPLNSVASKKCEIPSLIRANRSTPFSAHQRSQNCIVC